ncbi:unnamed protein product [Mycena citricolor]|uniref:Peptidase M20 dimerisation domain-containing protein n=1 Tax=Mycena citricolor TaxID=2018698 RepID=A0AAD2HU82_9AGAR|nr:unnamed protein product [Mycena citricolor]
MEIPIWDKTDELRWTLPPELRNLTIRRSGHGRIYGTDHGGRDLFETTMADEKNSLPLPMAPIPAPKPKPKNRRVRNAMLSIVTLSCLALLVVSHSGLFSKYVRKASAKTFKLSARPQTGCHQADVLSPKRDAELLETISDLLMSENFQSNVIDRLAGAIRIPTVVEDDMTMLDGDRRWDVFQDLQDYLDVTYPLMHDRLDVRTVNRYARLYTWEGSNEELAPILLTAHQDVVPVESETLSVVGEYMYGRGAADDKSRLTAVMTTLETMIENGFEPARTIVLSLGFDEELSGAQGSRALAAELEEFYGYDTPFAFVLEEGGGFSGNSRDGIFALPAVAEKGYLDLEVEVRSPGGHSSRPPAHTTIGMLGSVIVKYEDNPFSLNLDRDSVPYQMLQCRAKYSPTIPWKLKQFIDMSQYSDYALAQVEDIIFKDETWRHLIGTTQAVDIIQGGVKSNSLPEQAVALVNHRISTSSSVAETMARDTALLHSIAHEFNLNFTAFGRQIIAAPGSDRGTLRLEAVEGGELEPAPRSPISGRGSEAYQILSGSIKAAFNGYRGLDDPNAVIVSPGLHTENTGSRYYHDLSRNIFRYNHKNLMGDQLPSGSHTVNEVIRTESLLEMIHFFTTLILNADESTEIYAAYLLSSHTMASEKSALPLPTGTAPAPSSGSRRRSALLVAVTLACVAFSFFSHADKITSRVSVVAGESLGLHRYEASCAQAGVVTPKRGAPLLDAVGDLLATDAFQSKIITWLSEAVQVPTEVYDGMPPPGQDPRWEVFGPFHDYLLSAFPLVHETLALTKVNTYGLLYQWAGSDSSLKPILFAAHQDVVPVEPLTYDDWTHPPFSGHYDGKYIWGRGSSDDKSGLISIMATIETMIAQGFKPARTIVIAFGFDEEASGRQGAGALGEAMEKIYGKDLPFAFVVDEGGGFGGDAEQGVFAMPAVAEKGYLDVQLELNSPGGHSSIPPVHTTIGMLAALIVKYEENPYPATLDRDSVPYQTLQCMTEYSPSYTEDFKKLVRRSRHSDRALKEVEAIVLAQPVQRALIGTTQAVDIIHGGVKSNALPEQAVALVNHRISTSSSVGETMAHDTALLQGLAEEFNLTYTAFGKLISAANAPAYGTLTLKDAHGTALEPAPRSPLSGPGSEAYQILSGSIKATFNAHRGLDDPNAIIVAPGMSTGNTDTRYYWNLSHSIFRYNHNNAMGKREILGGAHTVNEAVLAESLFEMVRFFTTLILNADESTVI